MAGNQIQQHPYSLFVGLLKKPEEVFVRAIAGGDFFIIPHVVTGVLKRRIKAGVDPQGIAAQLLYIIKLLNNPLNIAYAVA
jgi:hypothetical protein